jgi:hypothetical protein
MRFLQRTMTTGGPDERLPLIYFHKWHVERCRLLEDVRLSRLKAETDQRPVSGARFFNAPHSMPNQDTGDHSIHPPVPNKENASGFGFGFGKQDGSGSRCPNFCDGVALLGDRARKPDKTTRSCP